MIFEKSGKPMFVEQDFVPKTEEGDVPEAVPEAVQPQQPQAGGCYVRDPVTGELTRA